MKRTLFIILSVGLIGLGAWAIWRPPTPVTVTITNHSSKSIASVRVEHERGVELVDRIGRLESRTVRFYPRGETSYKLTIRFSDGSETTGGGGYAESGYAFSETISDSGIDTDVQLPRY
jgi:hypothetical protein